jgi:alkanesulfonate monooxygenase SsuD/methylene tetrahydromethanopterin reductase-like flavin-dependent oxidoreductase (luciferase family)
MAHTTKKQLKIGLAAYGTGWDLDAWRIPDATNSGLLDPSVITDIALTAERGKLDYIFAGSSLASEPKVLIRTFRWDSAVFGGFAAAKTDHVGFLMTYNSSFEHPFFVARQVATLDRFSKGRAAINTVSGIDREGATENFKGFHTPTEESKYRRAAEFTEVIYRLLYESWDEDLLLDDKEEGTLMRPGSWHDINAKGEFFDVKGPLNVPPPIQKHIPNVHVGESEESLNYGAHWAQARFSPYYGIQEGKVRYAAQKQRVADAGGDPDKFKILPGVTPYVAGTRKEARARYRQVLSFEQVVELPAAFAAAFNLDAEKIRPDDKVIDVLGSVGLDPEIVERALRAESASGPAPFGQNLGGRVRDYAVIARDVIEIVSDDESVTLGDLFRVVQKNRNGVDKFIGDTNDFADWFEENLEESVFDGAQVFPPYHRGPADFFVDHVVPELQRRGIFRKEYESNHLDENLGTI